MKNKDLESLAYFYLYNSDRRDCISFVAGHFNIFFVLTDTDLHLKTVDNKFLYTLPLNV